MKTFQPLHYFFLGFFLLASVAFVELEEKKSPQKTTFYSSTLVELWSRGEEFLNRGDVVSGEEVLLKLQRDDDKGLFAEYYGAQLEFIKGNYPTALEYVKRLEAMNAQLPDGMAGQIDLIKSTAQVHGKFPANLQREFTDFVVKVADPKDAILFDYLEPVLPKIKKSLTQALKVELSEKIRIEIYPSVEDFVTVSTLTMKEITTSNTIALCKFNRLMLISPRVVLLGYDWLDTIAHELVHFLIIKKAVGAVPIWLHEGIARYLQQSWRGEKNLIDAQSETVLANIVNDKTFVRFDKMHPSMAKLGSAEETSRAFAEVFFAIHYIVDKFGFPTINTILERVAAGGDLDWALSSTTGMNVALFEETLFAEIRRYKPQRRIADVYRLGFTGKDSKDEDETLSFKVKNADDFLTIGDLLLERGHKMAAVFEYRKANKTVEEKSPRIWKKIATILIADGKKTEALDCLNKAIALGGKSPTSYLLRGKLHFEAGRLDPALFDLGKVIEMNPFIPENHLMLSALYAQLNDTKQSVREQQFYNLLRR